MTSKNKKPAIDTSRFSALLEEKQEKPAFPEPQTVTIQSHSIVCFAPARAVSSEGSKKVLYSMDNDVAQLLEQHTSGAKSSVINKLLKYAIEDLLKRNISIK